MTSNFTPTSDQLKNAVEFIKTNKPIYADLLDFYGKLFDAQEKSQSRIQIQPFDISEEIRATKARKKFPLIEIRDFHFDESEAARLFFVIGDLAKQTNPKLAADAEIILKAVKSDITLGKLFSTMLNGEYAVYEKIAGELKIANTTLVFISYHSLKPSLSMCAHQLSAQLNKEEPWLKGYCPICGSLPILSLLDVDGNRSLFCSFCWHPWSVRRVFCPFCENSDSKTLHYFFNEEENEFRVDLCNRCKKYLKNLDCRKTEHMIYPPLEQISSLHLDYKAKKMGYESGIQLHMLI